MISYLVDAVLLIALGFTSIRVTKMHRELARLRSYQGEFSTIVTRWRAPSTPSLRLLMIDYRPWLSLLELVQDRPGREAIAALDEATATSA